MLNRSTLGRAFGFERAPQIDIDEDGRPATEIELRLEDLLGEAEAAQDLDHDDAEEPETRTSAIEAIFASIRSGEPLELDEDGAEVPDAEATAAVLLSELDRLWQASAISGEA